MEMMFFSLFISSFKSLEIVCLQFEKLHWNDRLEAFSVERNNAESLQRSALHATTGRVAYVFFFLTVFFFSGDVSRAYRINVCSILYYSYALFSLKISNLPRACR